MTIGLVLLAAAVTGAALAYVLSPLLWVDGEPLRPAAAGGPTAAALEALLARRAELYAAIRELEDEHRLGKVTDAARAAARADLERQAVGVMRALDAWEAQADAVIAAARPARAARKTRPLPAGAEQPDKTTGRRAARAASKAPTAGGAR